MSNELYPRAPVRFVVCAAHFPLSPRLRPVEAKQAVHDRLSETFPLAELLPPLPVPAGRRQPASAPSTPQKLWMTNRERTCSVTIGPRVVVLERSDHERFEDLSALLGQVLEALTAVAVPAALSGVSLRYVNEIRHPSVRDSSDWSGLLHDSLTGPVELLDAEARQASAVAAYRLSGAREIQIVSGAESEGFAVDRSGPLRIRPPHEGPFFRLDIAGEWTAPGVTMPPFAVEHVLGVARDLHAPIQEAFERAIGDELRAHFRGAGGRLADAVAEPHGDSGAGDRALTDARQLSPPDVLWANAIRRSTGAGAINRRSAPEIERDEQDLRLPAVRRQLSDLLHDCERREQAAQHEKLPEARREARAQTLDEAQRNRERDAA